MVINKADLADSAEREQAPRNMDVNAPGVVAHLVSARTGMGIKALLAEAAADETVGVLGKKRSRKVGPSRLVRTRA